MRFIAGILFVCLITLSSLYFLYWLKVKLDVSFNIGNKHTPIILEEYSKGIIKCEWFPNPHHCN